MAEAIATWDGELVRKWLESRVAASRLDQGAADKRGYEARDDYDKAAAEEWVCRTLASTGAVDDRGGLATRIKELIAKEDYRVTGVHDDERFERHVRTMLRKVAKMVRTNDGFERTSRYQ